MASTSDFQFDPIEDALEAFGRGEFVVVMDDESRENEGDLCIAASEITTEKMAFFIRHTRSVSSPLSIAIAIANAYGQLTPRRALWGMLVIAGTSVSPYPSRG